MEMSLGVSGKIMSKRLERRRSARHPLQGGLTLIFQSKGRFRSAGGNLINISREGICFESETTLEPNTNICIQMGVFRNGAGPFQDGKMIGTTRWCVLLGGDGGREKYRIGVIQKSSQRP